MFDRLEDLLIRYEEVMGELQEPDVANDPERFRRLMKEQSDLGPIVEAYREYKQCKQNIEDSLIMLDEESDDEMREMAKEELNESKARVEELEQELKILLLPKDPNDDKNVMVEIRAGAGGGGFIRGRDLPYVCPLCGRTPLEDRDDLSEREWDRRIQGMCIHDHRTGSVFPFKI